MRTKRIHEENIVTASDSSPCKRLLKRHRRTDRTRAERQERSGWHYHNDRFLASIGRVLGVYLGNDEVEPMNVWDWIQCIAFALERRAKAPSVTRWIPTDKLRWHLELETQQNTWRELRYVSQVRDYVNRRKSEKRRIDTRVTRLESNLNDARQHQLGLRQQLQEKENQQQQLQLELQQLREQTVKSEQQWHQIYQQQRLLMEQRLERANKSEREWNHTHQQQRLLIEQNLEREKGLHSELQELRQNRLELELRASNSATVCVLL